MFCGRAVFGNFCLLECVNLCWYFRHKILSVVGDYVQMSQPAIASSSELRAAGPRPIRTVVVPQSDQLAAESLVSAAVPYRTRVDYRADDDDDHVSRAPAADHVTRSRDTATGSGVQRAASAQLINLTSPTPRNAAVRIQVDGHLHRDKQR